MAIAKPKNIDEYIAGQPVEVQLVLEEIRTAVKKKVPEAEEAIKYNMPTFVLNGKNLVHFSAFKSHIGFYPAPTAHPEYVKDLEGYKTGKGSIQFPLDEPMPLKLIAKIIDWQMANL